MVRAFPIWWALPQVVLASGNVSQFQAGRCCSQECRVAGEYVRYGAMDKVTVIAKLREYEPELKAAGILRLSLFGSVARGEASSASDVDLMAEFDSSKEFSLLDMVRLENRLADILGVRVDLTSARALRDRSSRTRHTRGRPCLLATCSGCRATS